MKKGFWGKAAKWLLVIGGVNWGLTALNFNVVEKIADWVSIPLVAPVVYGLVAVSAIVVVADKK